MRAGRSAPACPPAAGGSRRCAGFRPACPTPPPRPRGTGRRAGVPRRDPRPPRRRAGPPWRRGGSRRRPRSGRGRVVHPPTVPPLPGSGAAAVPGARSRASGARPDRLGAARRGGAGRSWGAVRAARPARRRRGRPPWPAGRPVRASGWPSEAACCPLVVARVIEVLPAPTISGEPAPHHGRRSRLTVPPGRHTCDRHQRAGPASSWGGTAPVSSVRLIRPRSGSSTWTASGCVPPSAEPGPPCS